MYTIQQERNRYFLQLMGSSVVRLFVMNGGIRNYIGIQTTRSGDDFSFLVQR